MAGTPGNRTQLPGTTGDNGFEGRGEHQPLNHSQVPINKQSEAKTDKLFLRHWTI